MLPSLLFGYIAPFFMFQLALDCQGSQTQEKYHLKISGTQAYVESSKVIWEGPIVKMHNKLNKSTTYRFNDVLTLTFDENSQIISSYILSEIVACEYR